LLKAALATTAAIASASPAFAQVTVTSTGGSPLANQIYGIAGTGTTVYGSSPNNDGVANVTFTANTQIAIGAGFAQLNDATPNVADWTSLIINPLQNFTDFKFSTMLTDAGTITVYYLLTGCGCDATNLSNFTQVTLANGGVYAADNNNLNRLLSGATFDAFAIQTSAPIAFFEVKQLSFNGVGDVPGVPEPATWGMMLLGFAGMGMVLRRSRRSGNALMQVA
jgi:hypothetical protein